jgi:hypothetical protein
MLADNGTRMQSTLRNFALTALLFCVGLAVGCGKPQDRGVIVGGTIPAMQLSDKLARQGSVSTTELYPIPAQDVYADLAQIAGNENLIALANNYLIQGESVKTLHITEIALAGDPQNASALALRDQALVELLERAENGLRNDYEIYWLKSQLDTAP